MGMFDNVRCKYPLPVAGANDLEYQTKDTPAQFLDWYEIRKSGTLWHETYEHEDKSKYGKWCSEHPGQTPPEGMFTLFDFAGCFGRKNKRWERCKMTGEIRFYAYLSPDKDLGGEGVTHSEHDWLEWSAYFVDGKLKELHQIKATDEVAMQQLLKVPCQRCGGEGTIYEKYARCCACGLRSPLMDNAAQVAGWWNERPVEAHQNVKYEWQSIDTAPRNGDRILCHCLNHGTDGVALLHYSTMMAQAGCPPWRDDWMEDYEPTLWAPMTEWPQLKALE